MRSTTARALALAALSEWRNGRQFADAILPRHLAESRLNPADRGLTNEIFYGILRNLTLLDFWIDRLRAGSLDHDSRDLLRLGLYQIFFLRTPAHAAVFETVALAGRRNRGLINGVLRSALRAQAELQLAGEAAPLEVRFSHPKFLVERWRAAFGEANTAALLQWNNQPPPVYARKNLLRSPNESKDFFRLDDLPLEALARGEIYIQDPSTAFACELLDPQPNESILDACAAPGGKTSLLAQMMQNSGRLVACEREPARVVLLRENLQRLGVQAEIVRHDWHSGVLETAGLFDRILLDAPCTNTGVMRRRVDVRWRLTSDNFLRMQKEQLAILRNVLPLLKPGGVLVYSTCSLEAEENENVVQQILSEHPALRLETQRSVRPFRDGFDGAFAAKLLRLPS